MAAYTSQFTALFDEVAALCRLAGIAGPSSPARETVFTLNVLRSRAQQAIAGAGGFPGGNSAVSGLTLRVADVERDLAGLTARVDALEGVDYTTGVFSAGGIRATGLEEDCVLFSGSDGLIQSSAGFGFDGVGVSIVSPIDLVSTNNATHRTWKGDTTRSGRGMYVQREGTGSGAAPSVSLLRVGDNSAGPVFDSTVAGGTFDSMSAAPMGASTLFRMLAFNGASGWLQSARMSFVTSEAHSLSAAGAYIAFDTIRTGELVSAERMRVSGAGNLLVGLTSDSGLPAGGGSIATTGGLVLSGSSGHAWIGPSTHPDRGVAIQREGMPAVLSVLTADDDLSVGSTIVLSGARGTFASPTTVKANNVLGAIKTLGYEGSGFANSAGQCSWNATEDWTSSAHGLRFLIQGTVTGTLTTVETTFKDGNWIVGPLGLTGLTGSGGIQLANDLASTNGSSPSAWLSASGLKGKGLRVEREGKSSLFLTYCASDTPSDNAGFNSYRSRGTLASPAAIQSGDILGAFAFGSFDGTSYVGSLTGIGATAIENHAPGACGSRLFFTATPIGSATPATTATLDDQRLVIFSTLEATASTGSIRTAGGVSAAKGGVFGGPVVVQHYTVATLPTASTWVYGMVFVSDATNAAGTGAGTAPTGGGSVKRLVYSDGTNWLLV